MVKAHMWVGNLLVLAVIGHIVLMYLASSAAGKSPLTAFPDNYTVGLISVAAALALVSVAVLARAAVRRAHYEIFLCFHIVSMAVLFPAVLWHADGAWKVTTYCHPLERSLWSGASGAEPHASRASLSSSPPVALPFHEC